MINFWVAIKNTLEADLLVSRVSLKQPFVVALDHDTLDMLTNVPDIDSYLYPFKIVGEKSLLNCYTRGSYDVSLLRRDLSAMMKKYPDEFMVLGAWDYDTGLELGTRRGPANCLVGAPLFIQPPGLLERYIKNGKPDTVFTIAGQAPRMFS